MKSHTTLQEAMDSGCILTEYHRHKENINYTVHCTKADGTVLTFTNISPDHLTTLLSLGGKVQVNLTDHWESRKNPKKSKGIAFHECKSINLLKLGVENGGRITDYHKTAKGNYAVHIETPDGERHSYSSVSLKHLESVPGFIAVEE